MVWMTCGRARRHRRGAPCGSTARGEAVRRRGRGFVADALLQPRRQPCEMARSTGLEGERLHGARMARVAGVGRARIAFAHEQQVVAPAADALDAFEIAGAAVDV